MWQCADFPVVAIGLDTNENEGIFSQYESIRKAVTAVTFTIYNMQNRNVYSYIRHIITFQHFITDFSDRL